MRVSRQTPNQVQQSKSGDASRAAIESSGSSLQPHLLLQLQRTAGNQALLRMLNTIDQEPRATGPARLAAHTDLAVQRMCSCGAKAGGVEEECEECKTKTTALQRYADGAAPSNLPPSVPLALASGGGVPLGEHTRSSMEHSFGADFGGVRIHTGSDAARASHDLNAAAFTTGQNIYFGAGQYQPETRTGQLLLAHELTHTIQQRGAAPVATSALAVSLPGEPAEREADEIARIVVDSGTATAGTPSAGGVTTIQTDLLDDLLAEAEALKAQAEKEAEELAKGSLAEVANRPGTGSAAFSIAGCPPNFCEPFADRTQAMLDLAWAGPLMLAGIAKKVNPRVVPLWASYLTGGASPQNLSSTFGADFTKSPTTEAATLFLMDALRKDIEKHYATYLGDSQSVTYDFTSTLEAAVKELDTPGTAHEMNFTVIGDIAGNIAGGIGKDEASVSIGAKPSPFNDQRLAQVSATLARQADGTVLVTPTITFTVRDTLDLCPGNCGAPTEQVATISMSRFEATSLAGDVPFTIDFAAPAARVAPFVVGKPAPASAVTAAVTAENLLIRSAPSTSAAVVGSYPRGTIVTLLCETRGTAVEGESMWSKTDKGYVSNRFLRRTGSAAPRKC